MTDSELKATAHSIWRNQEISTLAVAKALLDLIDKYVLVVGRKPDEKQNEVRQAIER